MKYGILQKITDLKNCTVANITICNNPLKVLKENDYTHLRLIQIENEAPEGTFCVKMEGGKFQLINGSFYGYKIIDLSKHLIEFEPDSIHWEEV